jgi:hypothetical protein
MPATVVTATAFVWSTTLIIPCSWLCDDVYGPLALRSAALPLSSALIAYVMTFHMARRIGRPRAEVDWLLAIAFATLALVDGLLPLVVVAQARPDVAFLWQQDPWFVVTLALHAFAAAAAIGAFYYLAASARRLPSFEHRWKVVPTLLAGLLTISSLPLLRTPNFDASTTALALAGLVRLIFPALAAYGLIRYRFLIPTRALRTGINRTLLMATFIAVFFIVSESTATFIGDRTGNAFVGILGASLLVLAMAPMERVVRNFTSGLAPPAPGREDALRNRMRFYRQQMDIVWLDGRMGFKERMMMDHLRKRLAIPADQADRVETDVLRSLSMRA